MKKSIIALFACIVIISGIQIANADSITMEDGIEIKGNITLILDNIVDIKNNGGTKRLIRDFNQAQPIDIVDVGYIHKRKIIGKVIHIDENNLHMQTPTGDFKIHRLKVRNIDLRQERINKFSI